MDKLTQFLKAVSDPSRQKIMETLRQQGELNVRQIHEEVGLRQPTVSQHLRILYDAGVIESRKEGREVYYKLCDEVIYDAISGFMKRFGKGGLGTGSEGE